MLNKFHNEFADSVLHVDLRVCIWLQELQRFYDGIFCENS